MQPTSNLSFANFASRRKFFLFIQWLLSFWTAFSTTLLAHFAFITQDEFFSRKEILLTAAAALASFIAAFLLIQWIKEKRPRWWQALFLSFVIAAALAFFSRGLFEPHFALLRNFELSVLELEDGVRVDLVWAYWADPPNGEQLKSGRLHRLNDISFNQFSQNNGWEVNADGLLSSQERDASLTLMNGGLHNHVPVLCVLSHGGAALVSLDINSTKTFYTLNGTDTDPLVIAGLSQSITNSLLSTSLLIFALTGVLYVLCLLLSLIPVQLDLSKIATSRWMIVCASFFVPVALALLVFALVGIYPFGERTFLRVDMALQYSGFLSYLRTLFGAGNDLFYTFSKNGGGDFYFLFAYYLVNPINWLINLAPLPDVPNALSWLVLLRIGLCGLAGGIYLRKIGRRDWASVVFSTAYALMTYALVNAENYFFIDGLIFLPLVLVGLERIFEGKSFTAYVFALAAMLVVQFYIGFMVCIFAVIYFLFRWLLKPLAPKERRRFLRDFVLGSLLSGALAAVMLLPVALLLGDSPKIGGTDILHFRPVFKLFNLFSKNYPGAYDLTQYKFGAPGIYINSAISLLVFLFFLNQRIKTREKLASLGVAAVFIVSFHILVLNSIWHGIAEPQWWPHRFAFLFGFWLIRLAYRCYEERDGIQPKHLAAAAILTIAVAVGIEKLDYSYLDSKKLYLEVALSLVMILVLAGKKRVGIALVAVSFIGLSANAFVIWDVNTGEALPTADFRAHVDTVDPLLKELRQRDSGFYRVENPLMRNSSDPMMFNYFGLTHYSSTTSQRGLEILSRMGIQQMYYWTIYTAGVPVAVDSLMGIRYLLSPLQDFSKPYTQVLERNGTGVFENPYALPIAFLTPKLLIHEQEYDNNVFEFVNQIYHSLSSNDTGDIFTVVPVEQTGQHWKIDVQTSDALYMYRFDASDEPDQITLNSNPLSLAYEQYHYGVYRLGSFQPGDQLIIVGDTHPEDPSSNGRQFYSENLEALAQVTDALKQKDVSLEMISSSHLRAGYRAEDADAFVYFSIPYSSGWQAEIDGTQQLVFPAPNGMMALRTPAGEHTLELRYTPPGFKNGAAISIATLILLIALMIVGKRKRLTSRR